MKIQDLKSRQNNFYKDVIAGLKKSQKELPSKYFYDELGSELFEQICGVDEYYIPRTERAIMETNIDEIIGLLGRGIVLIDYGCGDGKKARFLLDHLKEPAAYLPVDICREQLLHMTKKLALAYPHLTVVPICADYSKRIKLPLSRKVGGRRVVYFPGSSIGNHNPVSSMSFLKRVASVCGNGVGLLIGIDLKKDHNLLNKAYNDGQGITAEFNLNILKRINRELGADFNVSSFEHRAFYNPKAGRIEMHLVSLEEQLVRINDVTVSFSRGESIWTESSYKYDLDEFEKIASTAGFKVKRAWTDDRKWFSVQYLEQAL